MGFFMKAVRLLVTVCFVLILASCSLKPMWDMAGKWQQVEGSGTVEFSKNGTVTISDGTTSFTTKFLFVDPEHMRIDLGSLGGVVMKVSVSKEELVVTQPSGEVVKFKKVS